jgi:hypothetical protein
MRRNREEYRLPHGDSPRKKKGCVLYENALRSDMGGFDKDGFSQQQFNRSFDLAKPFSDMLPCWSNECFELWYLLHFCYRDTGVGRDEIYERLSKCHLSREYDKSDISVFDQLKPRLQHAINNAKRLAYENTIHREPQRNPSTRVHELVEVLLSFDPAKQ